MKMKNLYKISIEKNVEKCLEITGMAGKCECFVSAEELLEKGNMPYALYILDVEMKKLSGLELAEHIRTEDRNAVIIFMTNHSEMMQKAFERAGVSVSGETDRF